MNKILRIAGLLLSSGFFFIGSCTCSVIAGMELFSHLDARNISIGDTPTPHIIVLAEHIKNPNEIKLIDISGLRNFEKTNMNYSYLISDPKGIIKKDKIERIEFTSQFVSPLKQLVEIKYANGNNWRNGYFYTKYYAEDNKITLLYSRSKTFDHMFAAIPFALGCSVILFIIGKSILKFLKQRNPDGLT